MDLSSEYAATTEEARFIMMSNRDVREQAAGIIVRGVPTTGAKDKSGTYYDARAAPSYDIRGSTCQLCHGAHLECPTHPTGMNVITPVTTPHRKDRILQLLLWRCQLCQKSLLDVGSWSMELDIRIGLTRSHNIITNIPAWCHDIMRKSEIHDAEYASWFQKYTMLQADPEPSLILIHVNRELKEFQPLPEFVYWPEVLDMTQHRTIKLKLMQFHNEVLALLNNLIKNNDNHKRNEAARTRNTPATRRIHALKREARIMACYVRLYHVDEALIELERHIECSLNIVFHRLFRYRLIQKTAHDNMHALSFSGFTTPLHTSPHETIAPTEQKRSTAFYLIEKANAEYHIHELCRLIQWLREQIDRIVATFRSERKLQASSSSSSSSTATVTRTSSSSTLAKTMTKTKTKPPKKTKPKTSKKTKSKSQSTKQSSSNTKTKRKSTSVGGDKPHKKRKSTGKGRSAPVVEDPESDRLLQVNSCLENIQNGAMDFDSGSITKPDADDPLFWSIKHRYRMNFYETEPQNVCLNTVQSSPSSLKQEYEHWEEDEEDDTYLDNGDDHDTCRIPVDAGREDDEEWLDQFFGGSKFYKKLKSWVKILWKKVGKRKNCVMYCCVAKGGCGEVQHQKESFGCRISGTLTESKTVVENAPLTVVPCYSIFSRQEITHLDTGTMYTILSMIPSSDIEELGGDPLLMAPEELLMTVIPGPGLHVIQPRVSQTAPGVATKLHDDSILYQLNVIARKLKASDEVRTRWEDAKKRIMPFGELLRSLIPYPRSTDFRYDHIMMSNRIGACMKPQDSFQCPLEEIDFASRKKMEEKLREVQNGSYEKRCNTSEGYARKTYRSRPKYTSVACGVHAPCRLDEMCIGGKLLRRQMTLLTITDENRHEVREFLAWTQSRHQDLYRYRAKIQNRARTALWQTYAENQDLLVGDVYPSVRLLFPKNSTRAVFFTDRPGAKPWADMITIGATMEVNVLPGTTELKNRFPSLFRHAMVTNTVCRFRSSMLDILPLFCSFYTAERNLALPSFMVVDPIFHRSVYRSIPAMLKNIDISALDDFAAVGSHSCDVKLQQGDFDGDPYIEHIIQLARARAEEELLFSKNNTLTEQFNGNIVAFNQDPLLFLYLATRFKQPLSRSDSLLYMSQLETLKLQAPAPASRALTHFFMDIRQTKALLHRQSLPTNTIQLLEHTWPRDFTYDRGPEILPHEHKAAHVIEPVHTVRIRHGKHQWGAFTSKDLGTGENTLIAEMARSFGSDAVANFVNSIRALDRVFFRLVHVGYSLIDILPTPEVSRAVRLERAQGLTDANIELTRLITEHNQSINERRQRIKQAGGSSSPHMGSFSQWAKDQNTQFDAHLNTWLLDTGSRIERAIGKQMEKFALTKSLLDPCWKWPLGGLSLLAMVTCGSKGKPQDLSVLIGSCGMKMNGHVPLSRVMGDKRCHPYIPFFREIFRLEEYGFVCGNLLRGLPIIDSIMEWLASARSHRQSTAGVSDTGTRQRQENSHELNYARQSNGAIMHGRNGRMLLCLDDGSSGTYDRPVRDLLGDWETAMHLSPQHIDIRSRIEWLRSHWEFKPATHIDLLTDSGPGSGWSIGRIRYVPEIQSQLQSNPSVWQKQIVAAQKDWIRLAKAREFQLNSAMECIKCFPDAVMHAVCDVDRVFHHIRQHRTSCAESDLTPECCFDMTEAFLSTIERVTYHRRGIDPDMVSSHEKEAFPLVDLHLHSYLAIELGMRHVLLDWKLQREELYQICRKLLWLFVSSRSHPGQPAGGTAAASKGQLITQSGLKSKHESKSLTKLGSKYWCNIISLRDSQENMILHLELRPDDSPIAKHGSWIHGLPRTQTAFTNRLVQVESTDLFLDYGAVESIGETLLQWQQQNSPLQCLFAFSDLDTCYFQVQEVSRVKQGIPTTSAPTTLAYTFGSAAAYVWLDTSACRVHDIDPVHLVQIIRTTYPSGRFGIVVWEGPKHDVWYITLQLLSASVAFTQEIFQKQEAKMATQRRSSSTKRKRDAVTDPGSPPPSSHRVIKQRKRTEKETPKSKSKSTTKSSTQTSASSRTKRKRSLAESGEPEQDRDLEQEPEPEQEQEQDQDQDQDSEHEVDSKPASDSEPEIDAAPELDHEHETEHVYKNEAQAQNIMRHRTEYTKMMRMTKRRNPPAIVTKTENLLMYLNGLAESLLDLCTPKTGILEARWDEKTATLALMIDLKHWTYDKMAYLISQPEVETRSVHCQRPEVIQQLYGTPTAVRSIVRELHEAMREFGRVSIRHLMITANWMGQSGKLVAMDQNGMERTGDIGCGELIHFERNGRNIVEAALASGITHVKDEVNSSVIMGAFAHSGTGMLQTVLE